MEFFSFFKLTDNKIPQRTARSIKVEVLEKLVGAQAKMEAKEFYLLVRASERERESELVNVCRTSSSSSSSHLKLHNDRFENSFFFHFCLQTSLSCEASS
jgi:hypothetical protein